MKMPSCCPSRSALNVRHSTPHSLSMRKLQRPSPNGRTSAPAVNSSSTPAVALHLPDRICTRHTWQNIRSLDKSIYIKGERQSLLARTPPIERSESSHHSSESKDARPKGLLSTKAATHSHGLRGQKHLLRAANPQQLNDQTHRQGHHSRLPAASYLPEVAMP